MQLESIIAENTEEPLKCGEKGLQWRVSSYLCRQTWIRTIEGAPFIPACSGSALPDCCTWDKAHL